MRKVLSKSLLTAAATTGVLAGAAGYAQADAGAGGGAADSPGVLSGNAVQAPVHVPASVCGNTVDVIGVLNPAFGNSCANGHHETVTPHHPPRAEPPRQTEEEPPERPEGRTPDKPAEPEEKPAEEPVEERAPEQPEMPEAPVQEAAVETPVTPQSDEAPQALAETGSESAWTVGALGAAALLGGTVLYRRSTSRRA
ncbi:chaplin [Streptomyces sp. WMMB303]|uniref:chaplin n=1 Tax=unclassified Streptomyces TaxID=2593676 RepID=UPI0023EE17C3|nr:chaplin [Streptomyces sp. WMMB303]MDF4253433.1 chaplin [Streptomyces sp. WMMB303]